MQTSTDLSTRSSAGPSLGPSLGPSPGAARYPMHSVQIVASGKTWRATLGRDLLAESDFALLLEETGYPQVVYFPSNDVNFDSMFASDSQTTCPFKGEAEYFAAEIDGKRVDIAWRYPSVYKEVAAISGYVGFYANRISLTSESKNEE